MHIIFGKTHVSGSSASCLGDISSNEASDEDVEEVPKPTKKAEKTGNQGKRKRKGSTTVAYKDEKSPFLKTLENYFFLAKIVIEIRISEQIILLRAICI